MKRIILKGADYKLLTLVTVAVASIWLVLVFCYALRSFFGLSPGDMSGWVQAFGSIAAIIAAIWIAGNQTRREQAKIRRGHRINVLIALDIAERTCRLVGKYKQQSMKANPYGTTRAEAKTGIESIETLYLELKGIDLTTVGSANVVSGLLRLRGACGAFLESVHQDHEITMAVVPWMAAVVGYMETYKLHAAAMQLMDACALPDEDE